MSRIIRPIRPLAGPTRRSVVGGAAALLAGCQTSSTLGPGSPGTTTLPTGTSPLDPWTSTAIRSGRPIIYIYSDQIRWNALGAYGNPVVPTPNIDRIARESVQFSTCITNGPSCRASRTSMMSGLHVYEHGVDDNTVFPNPKLQSHVRRLRDEAGYYTMVIGKTHLQAPATHDFTKAKHVLQRWGFSDSIELPDPQEPEITSEYSKWLESTTPKGEVSKWQRLVQYVAEYDWFSAPPDEAIDLSTEDHMDSWCARTTADFIRAYAEDKPLYLQVNFPGPHPPFDATSEFKALVDPNDPNMPLPILVAPQPPVAPLVLAWGESKLEDWTEETARLLLQSYYAKIALVDTGLGQVIEALEETGLWDDAWIIVHSDHGELATDHMYTGKVVAFEGAIRVPLLIRPPGGVTPWVSDGQVDTMDTTATLLSLAGLDPTGFGERDLVDRVLAGPYGPTAHETKDVLFENVGSTGLRTETMKMTWDLATNKPVELYDLVNDPDEVTNRVLDPAFADPLAEMTDRLRALRPLP